MDLLLVDHNKPTQSLESYELGMNDLTGVVDHHVEDELGHLDRAGRSLDPCRLERAGSCTSLILRHLQGEWDEPAIQPEGIDNAREIADSQISLFGLAAILTDTVNLTDASKTCDVDRWAVSFLEDKLLRATPISTYKREPFWKEVQDAKANIGALSVRDVLRKDYKSWTVVPDADKSLEIGVAAVVKPLKWLLEKASTEGHSGGGSDSAQGLESVMDAFAMERNLDVLAIMTAAVHGSSDAHDHEDGRAEGLFKRELLIRTMLPTDQANSFLKAFMQRSSEKELGVREHESSDLFTHDEQSCCVFWQDNVSVSRKGVAPLLRAALGECR